MNLETLEQKNEEWLLEDFVDVANQLLPEYLPDLKAHTKVKEEINPRLVRHYTTQNLIDEPIRKNRYAVYTYRHLLQLLLVKRLLSDGLSATAINDLVTSKNNDELKSLLSGGISLHLTTAHPNLTTHSNSALEYLENIKKDKKTNRPNDSLGNNPRQNHSNYPNQSLTTATEWIRLQVLDGLEIHLRLDFVYPNSLKEQSALNNHIIEQLTQLLTKKKIMSKPQVNFIPLREGISSDSVTNLDLIVRITNPELKITKQRPKLNLGLVIDRSGSMEGKKIDYARKAACYAVEQLSFNDRISITIYDDKVEVLVPSTLSQEKEVILNKIKRITARGSTALHDGWLEGGKQVSKYLKPEQLNRVILLSDGLANIGETNPDVISTDVHGLSKHGVSTTTMGIGDDYNEDLMQAIANSGDGNYYYIQDPEQLESIFANELLGIMATIGQKVSIGIKTLGEVELVDVFNDLEKTNEGNYKLPNLIAGNSIDVVLRLKIPPLTLGQFLADFRLAYDNPETKSREVSHYSLQLPVLTSTQLNELPLNEEVRDKVTQLMASRARDEAVRNLDRGDVAGTKQVIKQMKSQIFASAPTMSPRLQQEIDQLDDLEKDLEKGEIKRMRKNANYQSYQERSSRSDKSN